MRISFLVPTFKDPQLPTLVSQIVFEAKSLKDTGKITDFEVLVSDDFPNNIIADFNQESYPQNVRFFRQQSNLGIGKNFKFLYENAVMETLVIVPGDGEWPVTNICELIENNSTCFESNVVLTRRVNRFPNYSLSRKIVSLLFNFIASFFTAKVVTDLGSIKFIPKTLVDTLVLDSPVVELEILLRGKSRGLGIKELVIENQPRTEGLSTAISFSTISSSIIDMLRLLSLKENGVRIVQLFPFSKPF